MKSLNPKNWNWRLIESVIFWGLLVGSVVFFIGGLFIIVWLKVWGG